MIASLKTRLAVFAALIISAVSAQAADSYDKPAIGGYDVVSYHQESGPVRGSGFHAVTHDGASFLFANEENKAAFEQNPEKYVPAYNGYCAFGASLGKKFHSNPEVYKVVDGVVYLNINGDIQKKWEGALEDNIEKADKNWMTLSAAK